VVRTVEYAKHRQAILFIDVVEDVVGFDLDIIAAPRCPEAETS